MMESTANLGGSLSGDRRVMSLFYTGQLRDGSIKSLGFVGLSSHDGV